MTALKEYQRLECTGLWRGAPDAQRREVIVAFGDATLVISDARNVRALAHWSLPAVIRLNPARLPALYVPGPDAGEELEIEDETMIAAISKVHALIEARRPHPGRLRTIMLGTALAAVVVAGIFWMPRAMIDHTAAALPFSKRQEIGQAALADLARLTGTPCNAPEGREALVRLHSRILGSRGELLVLANGLDRTEHLPGRIILIPRSLVEGAKSPEALAGAILAEDQRRKAVDPVVDLLGHAGIAATIRLLTTGDLPDGAVSGYGVRLLTRMPAPLVDADLLPRFADAGLSSAPYAYSLDPSGESVLGLIEADPFRTVAPPVPVMPDSDWVALQGICAG